MDAGRRSGSRREQQVGTVAIGDDLQEHLDTLIHDAASVQWATWHPGRS